MRHFLFTFLTFLSLSLDGLTQLSNYPAYHPPLLLPQVLSANFGELRPNHFHMGVDFKTNGKIGYNLYSIEDGYLARVKASPYGYGKVIYINHVDGRTSVYAHCSEFKGAIDSLVLAKQKELQQFEVEIFPAPNEIPLKKGEIIALSGNTGSSTAPHLHFEIRDTPSEAAMNPLVYGFQLADNIAPEIRKLNVFAVNRDGYQYPQKVKEQAISKVNGILKITNDTLRIPAHFCSPTGGIGFAFDVIDKLNGAPNQCAIYGTYFIVDGDTIFGQRMNQISFEETRYINTHRVFNSNGKYHKSYKTVANPLGIYINDQLGIVSVHPGDVKSVQLIAYDVNGNQSHLQFILKVENGEQSNDYAPDRTRYLYPNDSLTQNGKNWSVKAGLNSVYEPTPIIESSLPHFCEASVLVQNATEVRIKLENPTLPIEKYFIAVATKGGQKALSTTYEEGYLVAESKYAGKFSIQTDVTPPSIRGVSYNNAYTVKGDVITLKITETQTDLKEYKLFIDGAWHLLEYESKGDFLIFKRPAEIVGEHSIKITAKDACGNKVVYERVLKFL